MFGRKAAKQRQAGADELMARFHAESAEQPIEDMLHLDRTPPVRIVRYRDGRVEHIKVD